MSPSETATAAIAASRAEAELMVGMLRNHGLRAAASADDAGGVEVALQGQGVRVLVASADLAAARRLLGHDTAPAGRLNPFQRLVVRLLGGGRGGPV